MLLKAFSKHGLLHSKLNHIIWSLKTAWICCFALNMLDTFASQISKWIQNVSWIIFLLGQPRFGGCTEVQAPPLRALLLPD